MTQAITINLPDQLYEQLRRTAVLSRQPVESIIAHSLAHSLPPLLEEIPSEFQADVFPLLNMNKEELLSEARSIFPARQTEEYEDLLEKKKTGELTKSEVAKFQALKRAADVLTFRKSYAAVLLKRRGYRIPSLNDLPRPQ